MTLKDLIEKSVTRNSEKIFLIDRGLYRRQEYTYFQVYSMARSIEAYFYENGIKKGDKILIYLLNGKDYVSILWACALSGVIAAPIDFNSNYDFVKKIYKSVGAKLIFCSAFRNPGIGKRFLSENLNSIYENENFKDYKSNVKVNGEDIFEIVYTSGTTAEPKGAVILNKNIVSNINSFEHLIPAYFEKYTLLSILPLSHLFEQNVGLFVPMIVGVKVVYISSKKSSAIINALNEEGVNGMVSVPLFLQSIKNKIENMAEKEGKLERLNKTRNKLSNFPMWMRRVIFGKVRKKFRDLRVFFVGGAALDLETERFWRSIGIEVLQGYGLTETAPLLTANSFTELKEGTVGKIIRGVEVRIENGEILAKGDNVFSGYYKNKIESEKVLKNGWFYTGDIGEFDNQGFLKLTGRKKNMILSPSGLNVYPEDIEKVLNKIPGIKESVVLGLDNGKKLVGVVLSEKRFDSDKLLKEINSQLSSHQVLSDIIKWKGNDFPRTPTRKVIRRLVEEGLKIKSKEKEISSDVLINLVSEVIGADVGKIKEESVLIDLGLDSIKRIELAVKIEEKFDIDFNEDDINDKTKIRDLRNLVENSKSFELESGLTRLNAKRYRLLRFVLQLPLFALSRELYKINVKGLENLRDEQVIYIVNHSSMFDTLTFLRSLPLRKRLRVYVAAAKDFFFRKDSKWGRILGTFGRLFFNAFAFSRDSGIKQSLKDFGEVMNRGGDVLIFPEGTRSLDGKLLPFKSGIGLLAWHMDVKVIPVKMKGVYEILPKGKVLPKRGNVEVIFGKPIKVNKIQSFDRITSDLYKELKKL